MAGIKLNILKPMGTPSDLRSFVNYYISVSQRISSLKQIVERWRCRFMQI